MKTKCLPTPLSTLNLALRPQTPYRPLGVGSPGWPPLLSHSTQALNFYKFSVALHPQKLDRPLGAQDGHLYFHTAPSLRAPLGPTHYPSSIFISCRNPKHLRWNCILHSIFIKKATTSTGTQNHISLPRCNRTLPVEVTFASLQHMGC